MEILDQQQNSSVFACLQHQKRYYQKQYRIDKTQQFRKDQFKDWFKNHLKKKGTIRKPEYFNNIIKEQHKKMYVSNFIKKLKRVIVPRQQTYHQTLNLHESLQQQGVNGYKMSLNQECFYSAFAIITNFILIIFVTLSLAFQKIDQSIAKTLMAINLLFHLVQMLKQSVCSKTIAVNEITKLRYILTSYLYNQFIFDFVIFVCFILQLILPYNYCLTSQLIRVIFIFKIKYLHKHLVNLEFNLIDNMYKEQIWSLAKMFILNFVFAHFSCIILIIMAYLNPTDNWIIHHELQGVSTVELYVWAYYWAVTIMISLGFGDFTPIVYQQALCIIFIQIFSCMFFAYNINSIGSIIKKIKSYDSQTYLNMKIFNNYVQHTEISEQLQSRLRNYIRQSVTIKKQLNIQQQKQFINNLPQSFREDILKQSNKKVWNNLLFFKNLSQKMIFLLSIQLEKSISHPEQIIYKKYSSLNILIFQSGGYSLVYNRPLNFKKLTSNGKQVHKFQLNKNQQSFNLLSLNFLFGKSLNFDVKSNDYTVYYKLSNQKFISTLKNNPYDYEYYCMVRDKDSVLMNQYDLHECELCPKQKHYLFKCPKLHYIPLSEHVIRKFQKQLKQNKQYKLHLKTQKNNRKYFKCLKSMKLIKQNMQKYKCFILAKSQANETDIFLNPTQIIFKTITKIKSQSQQNIESQNTILLQQKRQRHSQMLLKSDIEQIYKKFKETEANLWQIQSDTSHNFKFYLKKQNSQNLVKKSLSKK